MTDETMALRGPLEKASDAESLREMIGFAAERLMALEVGSLTGRPWRADVWTAPPGQGHARSI